MEPKKTGKRIVSKGTYVGRLSEKLAVASFGLFLCLLCLIGVLAVALMVFFQLVVPPREAMTSYFLIGVIFIGGISFCLGYVGVQAITIARQIEAGIPLTRTNAADLAAEDSLVRASVEPTPEQQAVLLRAAGQGQETPAEKLVRPTIGP